MFTNKKGFKIAILFLPFLVMAILAFKNRNSEYPQQILFAYKGKAYKPGDTVYGFKNYVKLIVGDNDSPLILGVPHDGINKGDPEMPETGSTGRDINTLPLAYKIAVNFKSVTKKQPWIVINTIGRKIVDPNTFPNEIDRRYMNDDAKSTYLSYHDLLKSAIQQMAYIQTKGKGALFLDLHGQAHTYQTPQPFTTTKGATLSSKFIDQTELGYGLSNYAISQSDEYLDNLADSSSIAAVANANPTFRFSQLIRGPYSFGGLLAAEKVIAVPSPNIAVLAADAELFGRDPVGNPKRRPYFNGGYCTRKYGTTVLGGTVGFQNKISSIQAETPGITVRNNAAIIEVSGARFSAAIINYLNHWYGYAYKNK